MAEKKYINKVILNGSTYWIEGSGGTVGSGRIIRIYKNASSNPGTPTGGSYAFSTDTLSDVPSGWSRTKPTPSSGLKTWVSEGIGYPDVATIYWSYPYAENEGTVTPSDPDNPNPVVVNESQRVRIYTKSDTRPATPSATWGAFDFDSKTFSIDESTGWFFNRSTAAALEGKYLWFSERFFKKLDDDSEWSEPLMDISSEDIKNVTIKPYGIAWVFKVAPTNQAPSKPSGNGAYNFETKTLNTAPSGWSTTPNLDVAKGESIWYSVGQFEEGEPTVWSAPLIYETKLSILDASATNTKSFGVAIYMATAKTVNSLSAPTKLLGTFDYESGAMASYPAGWSASPALAEAAYASANPEDTNCKIWVSYNNYFADYPLGVLDASSKDSTGWTDPVEYINIAGILEKAKQDTDAAASKAKLEAIDIIKGELDRFFEGLARLDDVALAVDSMMTLYSWEVTTEAPDSSLTIVATGATDLESLNRLYTGAEYIGKYAIISGTTYKYRASSIELTTKVEALNTLATENGEYIKLLKTSEILQTPDKIAGLVSLVIGNATEIQQVKAALAELTVDAIKLKVVQSIGPDIENAVNTKFSSSFITMLNDEISLGVVDRNNHSVIRITAKDGTLIGGDVAITGTMIAKAIAADDLNIANTTYLKGDGTVLMAQGKSGTSVFYPNGTGSIAGGLLQWGRRQSDGSVLQGSNLTTDLLNGEFTVKVKGTIEANAGYIGSKTSGWTIGVGTTGDPALLGTSGDSRISLSPGVFSSVKGSTTHWSFTPDGDIILANGTITGTKNSKGIYEAKIKGGIYAAYGVLGSSDENAKNAWTIGTVNGQGCMYTGDPNKTSTYMIISPELMEAGDNATLPWWSLKKNGDAFFAAGKVYFNADGSGGVASGKINWSADGTMQIAGWTIDVNEIRSNNNITHLGADGTLKAISGETTLWELNKAGSGKLASGNISWTSDGKVTLEAGSSNYLELSDGAIIFKTTRLYTGDIYLGYDGFPVFNISLSSKTGANDVFITLAGVTCISNSAAGYSEITYGADRISKWLSSSTAANGLFYMEAASESEAQSGSESDEDVLYVVYEDGNAVSGSGRFSSNRYTSRR